MVINRTNITVSTAAGTFTQEIPVSVHCLLKHIFVKPASAGTTYDVEIRDSDGDALYAMTDQKGTLIEQVEIPYTEGATLVVTNASANEAFTVKLSFVGIW